jgi:hypothetical protein
MILDNNPEEQTSLPTAPSETDIRITPFVRAIWSEIIVWTFICLGLTLLYLLLSTIFVIGQVSPGLDRSAQSLQRLSFFVSLLFVIWPAWYSFKFATMLKKGMETDEMNTITDSFKFLRYNFAFYGILALIYIGFIILVLVLGILIGSLANTR